MEGWIKLHRQILDWEWYNDINVKVLFLHLLLTANYEDKKWQGTIIKRGQLVTSRQHLAEQTGLSEQQVRTAIDKLKSTNNITTKSTNKYTTITIENYELYQSYDEYITNKQPATQPTNNHNIRNKEDKKIRIKNIVVAYEEEIGHATPFILDVLCSYLDDLTEEMIIKAINIASTNNKKSLNYVKGILNSWINKGYKTVADIQESKTNDIQSRIKEALYGR